MKRHLVLSGLVSAVLLVVGFISPLQAAEIGYIQGRVEVQTSQDKTWKAAEEGMTLNIGDSVRTARRSKTDIVLDQANKQVIRLEQLTMVILNSTQADKINKLDLSEGKIYAEVAQVGAGMSFEVTTPSAVAGVRGTGWSVASSGNRDTVSVFKDSVNVQSFDANRSLLSNIVVNEGFKTDIDRFGAAGELTKLAPNEMREWREVQGDLADRVSEGAGAGDLSSNTGADAQQAIEVTEDATQDQKAVIEERGTEQALDELRELGGGSYH